MCGLVGAVALGKLCKKDEDRRQRFMRFATTELMIRTEERGPDATGASILFTDGNFVGIKRGEESSKWLAKFGTSEERYGSILKIWKEYDHPVKAYIGHCRKGTVGDKEDNENNHPIKIKNIVGVHNGVIRNDDIIEKHLGCNRDGKVDSEMIFRLFQYFTDDGKEPFTLDMLEQLIARLTGAFSVITFNADNMHQLPIFRDGRPLELVLIKELSVLLLVSDIKFWKSFHFQYERTLYYANINKLPSLLDTDIEIKALPDDSAAIIDLDIKCTKDTSIEDIWQWKKIPRDNKIWTSNSALNRSSTTGTSSFTGGQRMAKEEEEKKAKEKEASRTVTNNTSTSSADTNIVDKDKAKGKFFKFNGTTRKFDVQDEEVDKKVIAKTDSVIIPIDADKNTDNSDNNADEKTIKSVFEVDSNGQTVTVESIQLNDYSSYDHYDTIEVSAHQQRGSEDNNTNDEENTIDVEAVEMTEVDMTVNNVELSILAKKAYDDLPNNDRGYSDMDNLLTDIDIQDEETANDLGIKVVANRVACVQWVRGFMAGWLSHKKDNPISNEKTKIREKHISNLKSLVVILASYFSRSKDKSKTPDVLLSEVAMDHILKRPSFDIDNIKGVFNEHEVGKVEEAETIISAISKKN